MFVGIIIPAYDAAAFLGDAIASVLAQTFRDWSLAVIDDGSHDGTRDVAARFTDPRIRVIPQQHAGVSAARNRGIAAFNRFGMPAADAFLFLDADDWLAPDALARLAGALAANPTAVATCGRYARVGAGGAERLGPPPPHGHLLEELLTRNRFANGGHLLIRREAVETAGGFDPALSYGEDWEYWARLAALGAIAPIRGRHPVLFVRERPGSPYLSRAVDPEAYRDALKAIYAGDAVTGMVGPRRLADLRRRAEAEIAWSVGRELIRHGRHHDGGLWLKRSIRAVPSAKRLILTAYSWFRRGVFRPYPTAPDRDFENLTPV